MAAKEISLTNPHRFMDSLNYLNGIYGYSDFQVSNSSLALNLKLSFVLWKRLIEVFSVH